MFSRSLRRLLGWAGLALPGVTVIACSTILGIEPPIDAPPDAGHDASLSDGDAGKDTGPPCVHTSNETVDDAVAIFVASAPVGLDSDSCGDRMTPCATIGRAEARAKVFQRTRILVSRGVYEESVPLVPGVTIEGGWDVLGTNWIRTCVEPRNAAAVIQSPAGSPATVTATDLGGEATLLTLSIKTHAAAKGESLYGIMARGATTKVDLRDVAIDVSEGGTGAEGDVGPQGDAGIGTCPAADGGAGPVGTGGPGADGGAFGPTGYVPAPAGSGSLGGVGLGGSPPSNPPCTDCYSCAVVGVCVQNAGTPSCGSPGKPGCGGFGGRGGGPGQGGGASVGVFAWDGAQIVAMGGFIHAGAGGPGGPGGRGGPGGLGATGLPGDAGPTCTTSCGAGLLACAPTTGAGVPGAADGPGGRGGVGGQGGAGAGGPSFAIVKGGSATVTLTDTTLSHGDAGASMGNGSWGTEGDQFP